jgi:hypothetical protein
MMFFCPRDKSLTKLHLAALSGDLDKVKLPTASEK